eukprot:scaffold70284_cov37-Attheya_sp.AAC.2
MQCDRESRKREKESDSKKADFDSETSVGKPWTSRIEIERFGTFSSNCPGRNGDEAARKRAGGRGKNRRKSESK